MNRNRCRQYLLATTVLFFAAGSHNAAASPLCDDGSEGYPCHIGKGLDYFHTISGTQFNFGSTVNSGNAVTFTGMPIADPFDTTNFGTVGPGGLGNSDTVVERLFDTGDFNGTGETEFGLEIEMVALSLKSVAPVAVDGVSGLYDVFVTLDADGKSSDGTMNISLDTDPDGTNAPEGTFDSFFDLFLDAAFVHQTDSTKDFVMDLDNEFVGMPGHGVPGLQFSATECDWSTTFVGKPEYPGEGPNFFQTGNCSHIHPFGVHETKIAAPEPGTMALFAFGLMGLAARRRRKF